MSLQDLAALVAARNWAVVGDRALRLEQRQSARLGSRGVYVGYDADRELHQVRLANGAIVEGRSITNAGWAAGDAIAVSGSGRDAVLKSTPR